MEDDMLLPGKRADVAVRRPMDGEAHALEISVVDPLSLSPSLVGQCGRSVGVAAKEWERRKANDYAPLLASNRGVQFTPLIVETWGCLGGPPTYPPPRTSPHLLSSPPPACVQELREAAQAAGEREGIAEHARAEAAAALQAAREARDEALRRIRDMEGTGRGRGAEGDDRVGGGGGEGKGGGRSKEQQQQQQQQGGEMLAVPLPAAAAPHSTSVVASPAPSSPPLLPPLSGLSLSHSPRTPSSPRSSSAGSSEQATGGGEGLVGNSRAGGEGGSARGGEGGSSVVEVGGAKAREGLGGSAVRLSDLDVGGWGMAAGGVGLERLRAKVRQQEGEVQQLQREVQEARAARDATADELLRVSQRLLALEKERVAVPALEAELQQLRARHEVALVMVGERNERVDELEADLADVRALYKEQVALLAAQVDPAKWPQGYRICLFCPHCAKTQRSHPK
ncbi:unnamed protein product [Closterium sp. NIES-54]